MTDLRTAGDRIEQLLDELRTTAPRHVYDKAEELLRLVTDLYGAGLARVMELAAARESTDSPAPRLADELVADDLVASLLLVHGLHPESLAGRVGQALDRVRPLLAQHGGDVELLDIDPAVGAVHLRLLGTCDGCPSSAVTLRDAVERSIVEAAPEIGIIDVEEPSSASPGGTSMPISLVAKPDACPSEVMSL